MKLNLSQQQAVQHAKGPLLLVAGAGTGKTRVITEKIRYFLENKITSPDKILALTFTEKAAQEMQQRVDEAMPLGYQEPWISTFHSFCERILREEGLAIGLDPNYKIITTPEQWMLIRKHLFEFNLDYYRPLGNPSKFISSLLQLFSRAQDEAITEEEYLTFSHSLAAEDESEMNLEAKKQQELAGAYQKYKELKLQESKLDFGDLISWTLRLFKERPNILKKYQEQFELIMVDEFQDTNYAQYQLVKMLAPARDNPLLVVVGDDDQSIYKWRGASITNVSYFQQDYPQAEIITLIDNYRSDKQILDLAYHFIQHNPNRLETKLNLSKKLSPHYQTVHPANVKIVENTSAEEEADQVALELIKLNRQGYDWQQMAILARANNHLLPFVTACKRYRIPYQVLGNRGLFEQEEIKYLIALINVLTNPEDNISLFQLLHTPSLDVKKKVILSLVANRKKNKTNLWQEMTASDDISIHRIVELIEKERQKLTTTPATEILHDYVITSNYLESYMKEDSLENQLRIGNINRFFELIKRFETEITSNPLQIPNVIELANYLELLKEAGESPAQEEIEDIDTVNLMTVHAAKGLEFEVVVIPCLIKGRFPTRNRSEKLELPSKLVAHREIEKQTHVEEERRLFYVACTRAKEQLLLTYALNYGGKRESKPSPFLEEMFGDVKSEKTEIKNMNQLDLFSKPFQTSSAKPSRPPKIELHTVSYTQLSNFKTCPLMYKYAYVLRLPSAPSGALNFGQTLHRTLKDFHRRAFFDQQPTLEDLLTIFEKRWISGGYKTIEHQDLAKKRGREILTKYFQTHQGMLKPPLSLEQKFTIRFGKVKLIGSIDRIGQGPEGEVEIIDYKTGSENKTEEELQKEAKKSDQLTIYALAAQEDLKIKVDQVCLYFLEHQIKAVTTRSPKQLESKREEIAQQIEEMEKSDFTATPGFHCRWCAYNQICPQAKTNT